MPEREGFPQYELAAAFVARTAEVNHVFGDTDGCSANGAATVKDAGVSGDFATCLILIRVATERSHFLDSTRDGIRLFALSLFR